ncbi:disks large homolog 1-like [Ochotona princeps]|uniref:disks large homolog 1-like n=1 Tax=Ochotona princeps TaxID=9978 RepID=UPI002714FC5C|nr:disks large homolog 1-like [Ochotona princeps]
MPVKKKDTDRALSLLDEYCKKLRKPEEQLLKNAVKKVMSIFKSSLFQALLDIQEFYEVTLLNSQKSCEQKIEEANKIAKKWEKTSLFAPCHDNFQGHPELTGCNGPKENASCIDQNKENQCFENETEGKINQNQGKCPAQNCSVEAPGWMPVHHCTVLEERGHEMKYRYQDEDVPHDHSLPRLTHEVRGPELVHVSEKNLSQIENVHGYVLQSHISPLKITESMSKYFQGYVKVNKGLQIEGMVL